jgi:ankyrin repeat protein
MLIDY